MHGDFPKGVQLYAQVVEQIVLYTDHDLHVQIVLRV